MDLMSLPLVMIENIISYLSYDEIAKTRLVSTAFNEISSRLLNRGFSLIERQHSMALKSVKAQLPRRESERRYHQLSRHCDILTSIETRISMLNMTYSKFIDHKMCCFIPGKVLDEIKRVLTLVETESNPPRAHEVLQELRDISSMAIEHFDDKISPPLRKKLQETATPPVRAPNSILTPIIFKQEVSNLRRRSLLNAKMSLFIANQFKKVSKGLSDHKMVVWRQQRIIKQMAKRQIEQDAIIADLKKRIDECDVKYSEITHANVGGKALAGASDVSSSSQSLRHFSSQIKLDLSVLPIGTSKRNSKSDQVLPNMKPRKPVIKLPSLSDAEDDPPPRRIPRVEPFDPKKRLTEELETMWELNNEIQHLSSLGLKRTVDELSLKEVKKQKLE